MSVRNQNERTRQTGAAGRRTEERQHSSAKPGRRVHSANRRRKRRQAGKWKLAAVLILAFFMTLLFARRSSELSYQEQTEVDVSCGL